MKSINRTSKIRLSFYSAVIMTVLMLSASCSNMSQPKNDKVQPDSQMGIITVAVKNSAARTIMPELKVEDLTNIKLEGKWQGEQTAQTLINKEIWSAFAAASTIAIQTGTWDFTLSATLNGCTFSGTIDNQDIVAGTATTLEFTLESTVDAGGLSIDIKITEGDATAVVAKVKDTGGNLITTKPLTLTGSPLSAIYEINISDGILTQGYYNLELEFNTTDSKTGDILTLNTWKGVVRIVNGFVTSGTIEWKTDEAYDIQYQYTEGEEDFVESIYPTTYTRKSSAILPKMTKDGYLFEGWYTDSSFTAAKKIETISPGMTGDLPLYPRFIDTLYVSKNGVTDADGTRLTVHKNDGTDECTAFATVDNAVAKIISYTTNGYDTSSVEWKIMVDNEIYEPQSISGLTSTHAASLTVQGYNNDTDTDIFNGCEEGTTLTVNVSVPVTISKIKITGGQDRGDSNEGKGGGLNLTGTVNLTDMVITENDAIFGGGIYCGDGAVVTIKDTTIDTNTATSTSSNYTGYGAGIYTDSGSSLSLDEGTVISNNTATKTPSYSGDGGGLYINDGSTLEFLDAVTIQNNHAGRVGGGIFFGSSTAALNLVSGTKIIGNTASESYSGGGIYVGTNCTANFPSGIQIEKNSAGTGGAINNYGTVNLNGCTIGGTTTDTANTATVGGGAIVNFGIINVNSNAVSIPCTTEKENDIYIDSSSSYVKPVTVTSSLSGTGEIARITVKDWKRGTTILQADSGVTLTDTQAQRFVLTMGNDFFDKVIIPGEGDEVDVAKINGPVYVKSSKTGVTDPGSDGDADNPRYGTVSDPFATFDKAFPALAAGMDAEVIVDGEIVLPTGDDDYGISIQMNDTVKPKTLLIRGKSDDNTVDIINRNHTDDDSLQSRYQVKGLCISITTTAPVTFKNITITGGNNSENGSYGGALEYAACGGIYISYNSDVTLETGARVTGNKSPWNGGGIYVHGDKNAGKKGKLTIKDGAEISNNISNYQGTANQPSANTWECGGGGIYNRGIVIMEGGSITGNTAYYTGGGVFNRGDFTMTGGEISGNSLSSSTGSGDGLFVYNNTVVAYSCSIGGAAHIPKNSTNPKNAIYLRDGAIINLTSTLTYNDFLIAGSNLTSNGNTNQNVIKNEAGMTRAEFVSEISKFTSSITGTLTVDTDGTYAYIQ